MRRAGKRRRLLVVLCTETDDYCAPKGRVLPVGRPHTFTSAAYGHVREGTVYLLDLGSARAGVPVGDPLPTVAAGGGRGGGHAALCAAFLMRYFGSGGQWSDARRPMPTITAREGLAVVTTTIGGEEWMLSDIGMRMLQPRELARAQGFPDSYVLTGNKGQQIERIGNSVVPQMAEAIVRANLPDLCVARRAA